MESFKYLIFLKFLLKVKFGGKKREIILRVIYFRGCSEKKKRKTICSLLLTISLLDP